MKGPSKLDQLRALREGAHQPRKIKPPVVNVPASLRQTDTVSDTVLPVPWLAIEGECASCDKRRAALQASMRKRRVRQNEQ